MRYQGEKHLPASELEDLYNSVGWGAYTSDLEALVSGVGNSRYVVTARDDNGTLLGLTRIVGDSHTIAYLQDILVRPTTQRQGIGRELMNRVFQPFIHCRQHVLITDG
ncbi:GNAT family N-acetyltransferase [Corynebacterium poyangense]|uniref:GNAT family N-acetyltransferase n=1 Tax=Corynebacterium poyangense TaxID=2684405 RepID=A0A7H0SSL2_9CORY|nr:GNAT family N-acetyltransferase [Corynebacterium poyangense]